MTRLAHAPKPVKLAALRARLARLDSGQARPPTPGGCVPDPAPGAVTEALPDAYLETPAGFSFLAALAARAAALHPGPVLLVLCEREFDFGMPNAAALAAAGIGPGRVILVRAPDPRAALWALEEGARTRGLAAAAGAVLPDRAYDLLASRRLALAAERTGVPVLLLRRAGAGAQTAAPARWRVQAAPGTPAPFRGATGLPGLAARRWRIVQERAPGAPRAFEVEWNETALRFDPPSALVRPADPAAERRIARVRAA